MYVHVSDKERLPLLIFHGSANEVRAVSKPEANKPMHPPARWASARKAKTAQLSPIFWLFLGLEDRPLGEHASSLGCLRAAADPSQHKGLARMRIRNFSSASLD